MNSLPVVVVDLGDGAAWSLHGFPAALAIVVVLLALLNFVVDGLLLGGSGVRSLWRRWRTRRGGNDMVKRPSDLTDVALRAAALQVVNQHVQRTDTGPVHLADEIAEWLLAAPGLRRTRLTALRAVRDEIDLGERIPISELAARSRRTAEWLTGGRLDTPAPLVDEPVS